MIPDRVLGSSNATAVVAEFKRMRDGMCERCVCRLTHEPGCQRCNDE